MSCSPAGSPPAGEPANRRVRRQGAALDCVAHHLTAPLDMIDDGHVHQSDRHPAALAYVVAEDFVFLQRQGAADQVALRQPAACLDQKVMLLRRLQPFGGR